MKIYSKENLPRHIVRHSPDGFNWGYGGYGPIELARCLLIEVLGEDRANACYQDFTWENVAHWDDNWSITDEQIKDWHANYLQR